MNDAPQIAAVDLFCGVGGLTHGLTRAGVDVRLGVDIDPACKFPLEANNQARFLEADVAELQPSEIFTAFKDSNITLLAGCAPCQPFSSYSQSARRNGPHEDWELLSSFSELVLAVKPTLVTMYRHYRSNQFFETSWLLWMTLVTMSTSQLLMAATLGCRSVGRDWSWLRLYWDLS